MGTYVHTHTYVYTYNRRSSLHTYIHIHTHTYIRICVQPPQFATYIRTHTYIHTHTYVYTYNRRSSLHTYVHTHTYIHTYTHIRIYVQPPQVDSVSVSLLRSLDVHMYTYVYICINAYISHAGELLYHIHAHTNIPLLRSESFDQILKKKSPESDQIGTKVTR